MTTLPFPKETEVPNQLQMVSITICGKTIKNRTIWQLLIATIFMTCLAVIVPTLVIINNNLGNRKHTNYQTGKIDPGLVNNTWDGVIVWANVSLVNTAKLEANVRLITYPSGKYAINNSNGLVSFSESLTMRSGSNVFKYIVLLQVHVSLEFDRFNENYYMGLADLKVPLIEGSPIQYPFDTYISSLTIVVRDARYFFVYR